MTENFHQLLEHVSCKQAGTSGSAQETASSWFNSLQKKVHTEWNNVSYLNSIYIHLYLIKIKIFFLHECFVTQCQQQTGPNHNPV